jgi:hypothetical protein
MLPLVHFFRRVIPLHLGLFAWALQGLMALEDSQGAWPIQEGAFEIKHALEAIAEEVRL